MNHLDDATLKYWARIRESNMPEDMLPLERYVVGFLFETPTEENYRERRHYGNRVVMIRKKRPAWQAGCFNGPGGHVRDDETPVEAMEREFFEEAGLRITTWSPTVILSNDGRWILWYYRAQVPTDLFEHVATKTDEEIVVCYTDQCWGPKIVPNCRWALALSNDATGVEFPVVIRDRSQ